MSPIRRSFRRNDIGQQTTDDNSMSVDDDELPQTNSSTVDHLMLRLGDQYEFLEKWAPRRGMAGFDDLEHIEDGLWEMQGDDEQDEVEVEVEVKSEEEDVDIDIEVDELESDDHDPIDSFSDVGRSGAGQEEPSASTSTSVSRRLMLGKFPAGASASSSAAYSVITTKRRKVDVGGRRAASSIASAESPPRSLGS